MILFKKRKIQDGLGFFPHLCISISEFSIINIYYDQNEKKMTSNFMPIFIKSFC